MFSDTELPSTRPYLIRALYEWCTENGFTPYVAVKVDGSVQVPREYVQGGEIVLNVSMDATSSLKLGNEFIEFKARFAGTARGDGGEDTGLQGGGRLVGGSGGSGPRVEPYGGTPTTPHRVRLTVIVEPRPSL